MMRKKFSFIAILFILFLLFPTIIGYLGGQQPYAIPIPNLIGNSGFGVCSQADTNKGLATLTYDNLAGGNFGVGNTITGATSGATGKLITDNGATQMTLGAVTGCFQDNEQIGNGVGVTADVNGDSGVGVANDPMNNDSTGLWTDDGVNIALAFAAAEYTVTTNAATQRAWMTNLAFTAQKLYKVEIGIKDGTVATQNIECYFNDGAAQYGKIETTGAAWASIWFTFECATTTATGVAGFRIPTSLGGNNIEIRRFSVYEIRPGFTAADSKCFDLWIKDTTCDVYRYHWDGGTNSKNGSYYTAMMVVTAASDFIRFPGDNYTNPTWYIQQRGRTITIGKWIKTSTANHAKLTITDSVGSTSSSYHTGGGTFEWLEVARTINAAATSVAFYIYGDVVGTVNGNTIIYISQAMGAYGSSIGEGNYQPIRQEIIDAEVYIVSKMLNNLYNQSDTGWLALNVEADSDGCIPKGCKALYLWSQVRDSGSSAAQTYLRIKGLPGVGEYYCNDISGLGNDKYKKFYNRQVCNINGDIEYDIKATGANTFDLAYFYYMGIQIN